MPDDQRQQVSVQMSRNRVTPALAWLLLLSLLPAGWLALRHPSAMPRGSELSLPRTAFILSNSWSLTGFQLHRQVDDYAPAGRATVVGLTVLGGILVLGLGGMAIVRIARLEIPDGRILLWSCGLVFGAALVGMAVRPTDPLRGFSQGAAGIANSGVMLGAGAVSTDWRFFLIFLPICWMGSVGVLPLIEAFDRIRFGRRMSEFSRIAWTWSAGAFVAGCALLWCTEVAGVRPFDAPAALVRAGEASINARSSGWPIALADYSRVSVWLVVPMMLVGGATGSTAGGVRLHTARLILVGAARMLRGIGPGRSTALALIWTGAWAFAGFSSFLALLWLVPQASAERLAWLSISALGNVGWFHEPVSITGDALYLLAGMMLLARVGSLAFLWVQVSLAEPGADPVG
jgi:hypothetical protein